MTTEEHKVKLDAFIKAYNELEEFRKAYITKVTQRKFGSVVTIPLEPAELEKYMQLSKALDEARKELNGEVG